MSYVSATGYGVCRGCGRELTVARTMYDGWHDACAASSGLAEPLVAAGEVERNRWSKRTCRACKKPLRSAPTRWVGYHDKCANRLSVEDEAARRQPQPVAGRPQLLVDLGDQCYFCGDDLTALTITREHLTPTSRGGANDQLNVVAACRRCNGAKGDMTEDEFRLWLQRVAAHYLDQNATEEQQ